MTLDFTTTACRRPETLRATYASFATHLQGVKLSDSRLFLNIDPVGDGDVEACVDVACEHFGDVVPHLPAVPSFARAVRWCWMRPESAFFFHVEDDWQLTRDVNVADLLALMADDLDLSCVSLRCYMWPPSDRRICLSPGLFRTEHAREMALRMVDDANPEQQLRATTEANPHGGKHGGHYGRQYPDDPSNPLIRDIGRAWMFGSDWQKSQEVTFNQWVKRDRN